MKIKQLVSTIALKEGLKSRVKVGDVREIIGIISDLVFAEAEERGGIGGGPIVWELEKNGKARAKRKKKS